MADQISPLNDLSFKLTLKEVVDGVIVPLTIGPVTAFISDSTDPDAASIDNTLEVAATHLGSGKWFVHFDASVLTVALLDAHFPAATPYLIVVQPGGFRVYKELEYARERAAA